MPNFDELGLKVGPFFIEYKRPFSTSIQDGIFARLNKNLCFRLQVKTNNFNHKSRTGLETKLLVVRHMSRQEFLLPTPSPFQNMSLVNLHHLSQEIQQCLIHFTL